MKSGTGIHLANAKGLERALDAMPGPVATRAAKTGLRKGGFIMKRAIVGAAPRKSGELKKSFRVKTLRRKYRTSVAVVVELKHRYYYELLEFEGLKPGERVRPTGKGKNMKQLRGAYHPFAARAIERSAQQASATVMAATKQALGVEAGKAYQRSLRGK